MPKTKHAEVPSPKSEPSRTDAEQTDPADKLASDTPSPDVDGGRISSADGRFVADHRPSR